MPKYLNFVRAIAYQLLERSFIMRYRLTAT